MFIEMFWLFRHSYGSVGGCVLQIDLIPAGLAMGRVFTSHEEAMSKLLKYNDNIIYYVPTHRRRRPAGARSCKP